MDPGNATNSNTKSLGPVGTAHHVTSNTQEQSSDVTSAPIMPSNPLPVNLYENLLFKLVTIMQLTHQEEGIMTPAAKQIILQATNDFKDSLVQAKEIIANLPGGELLIQDQDEVIQMLEMLRDRRRALLERFSKQPLQSSAISATEHHMEIDSVASTPADD